MVLTTQILTDHEAGVLALQQIRALFEDRHILAENPLAAGQLQPSSLDLRLGKSAYRVRASFLPGTGTTVAERVKDLRFHDEPLDLSRPCLLERGGVYIIPLQESLALPEAIAARANPKSSIGRIDVFTRLLVDQGTEFDEVPAGYHGPLYLEVVPRTWSILARAGDSLNQIRFSSANFDTRRFLYTSDQIAFAHERTPLVYIDGQPSRDLGNSVWVTVDLEGDRQSDIVGYRAIPHGVIDLSRPGTLDPAEFWEPVNRNPRGELILNPGDFYILVSREGVVVPPDLAAEMVAYHPPVGEFRAHYAGFFDPGFGHGRGGTRAVLEVRSHDVPFLLRHGQKGASLVYERMSEVPEALYGDGIGSNYGSQGLQLSKHFLRPARRT